jgi:hypothetical protein
LSAFKDVKKLAQLIYNYTSGQLSSLQLTELNCERLAMLAIYELFVTETIVNRAISQQIIMGHIRTLNDFERLTALEFSPLLTMNLVDRSPLKASVNPEDKTLTQTKPKSTQIL